MELKLLYTPSLHNTQRLTFNRTSMELKLPIKGENDVFHRVATFNRTSMELKLRNLTVGRACQLLIEPVWN